MQNIRQLTTRMELSFWSVTIPLLSESKLLRILLPALYRLSRKEQISYLARVGLIWSLSGFLVGLVLGVISN
jgi:hypothetical protein